MHGKMFDIQNRNISMRINSKQQSYRKSKSKETVEVLKEETRRRLFMGVIPLKMECLATPRLKAKESIIYHKIRRF